MHWVTAIINLAQFANEEKLNPEDYVICGSLALRLRGYSMVEPKDLDIKFSPKIEKELVDCGRLVPNEEMGKLVNEKYDIDAGGKSNRCPWDFNEFFGWSTKLDPSDPKSPYVLTEDGLLEFYRYLANNKNEIPLDKLTKFVHRVKMIEDFQTIKRISKIWGEDGLPYHWR